MTRKRQDAEGNEWEPRLPVRDLQGEFFITAGAATAAERLLPGYRGPDGDHEGIVFLLGRYLGTTSIITTVLAPDANHGRGHVLCSETQFAEATAAAHDLRLGILGHLHTHPGPWTEHSEGDDKLMCMPFDGMISLVVPWYCHRGLRPLHNLGVHQYQGDRWVLIDPASTRLHLRLIPDSLDLR